ncbi:hypothetical protein FLAG1_09513 [Fusarium langsethiae]|uniref:Uncharacterized protein n=1 Tax=Fusarium langsethiae TaxID=179993 RepID=A0A0M9EQP9_FUSLA|nr:hypothetical protein FLAG1_09513 [Fusarium langsethiae]GKU06632.1 unnamed protein product [Fusarium langsethiae]GKU21960.1 unnamed protein product [Fusarium langsethiae]
MRRPLYGGTEEEDSQQLHIELPLMLTGHRVMTTPDTGSDRNVMSENKAKELGLSTDGRYSPQELFTLANGRVIHSKGKVATHFAFPFEEMPPLPIEFHLLESLNPSIVVGKAFLDATETLTTYLDRLVRTRQTFGVTPFPPRILHLSPPRRILWCFINSTAVRANADTGAEMNLASPEFAACSGSRIEPADRQHQFVQLADGSITPISGFFRARFNPFQKPLPESLRPRAHMKTFYILKGLTSDVLLGRHLLFEIHAFVEQANAFLDIDCQDLSVHLNLIAWLNRWRSRSNSESAKHASFQEIDSTFWHKVDVDDAREQRMRQQAEANASHIMTEADRTAARAAESQRQDRYSQRRQKPGSPDHNEIWASGTLAHAESSTAD